jgi:ubiquinone/menaquinone biosynthesis C-methylase UbiE
LKPSDTTGSAIDPVVETYSELAHAYDDASNTASCWGRVTQHSLERVALRATHKTIVDVGCGTGRELMHLALNHPPHVEFVGVEPAANMRKIAAARTAPLSERAHR